MSSGDDLVGTMLAETYEVTKLLGRGGMGTVWEANHTRLPGRRVAIKMLHADGTDNPEALIRFRREATILSRLGHANIVEVIDFNVAADGQPYLVLELLEGETLGVTGPSSSASRRVSVRSVALPMSGFPWQVEGTVAAYAQDPTDVHRTDNGGQKPR